jgi:RIO kinase 1
MSAPPIEDGQFDDAPGDVGAATPAVTTIVEAPAPAVDARAQGEQFIDDVAGGDDAALLEWSDEEHVDEDSEGPDEADFDDLRVEDEDWEMAERGMSILLCLSP